MMEVNLPVPLVRQIQLVSSAKNVILIGGSAYFVTGMWCSGSTIVVLDDFPLGQMKIYPKLAYTSRQIEAKNRVVWVKKSDISWDHIAQWLDAR